MIRPSISGALAVGALLVGATLSGPTTMSIAPAAAEARATGPVQFLLIGDGQGRDIVVSTGVLHAKGVDKVLNDRTDRFTFSDGTVTLKHKPKAGTSQESFDPVTCHFQFKERGTWRATKGTGAYAGITGKGTYVVSGHGVACGDDASAEVFISLAEAKGTMSY